MHPTLGASRRLATVVETPASSSAVPPKANADSEGPPYNNAVIRKGIVHTGIILNRHPILTRTPTKFELAYYNYQSRIERALHNPIPYEFYFRPGSLLEGKFNEEESAREREAFGRVSHVSEAKNSFAVESTEEPVTLMPRKSEADWKGDVKSLNRKGDRNLYLVVKSPESGKEVWKFPQTELVGEELLHEVCCALQAFPSHLTPSFQAAKRELRSQYAMGMDTWVVGRIPAGLYRPSSTPEDVCPILL